jgi:7,8-dihydropterin-6-yl-methyl-4-(beta-D-ribofuranosyl)aminobenzene 5'-phosphate synthase
MPLAREELQARVSLRLSGEPQEAWPDVWTSGEIAERPHPEGRSAHHVVRGGSDGDLDRWLPDPYRDDLSLVIETSRGLILLCGCCHAGLLNTLEHVERVFGRPIVAIAGGTHLANVTAQHLQRVSDALAAKESLKRVYLNHCSGQAAYVGLLLSLGLHVVQTCPAGLELDLEGLL